MAKFLRWKSLWFKFSELICGKKYMSQWSWTCAKCLTWNWIHSRSKLFRKKLFTLARATKWIPPALTFCSSQPINGKSANRPCYMTRRTNTMGQFQPSTGLTCNSDGVITTLMTSRGMQGPSSLIIRLITCRFTPLPLELYLPSIWLTTCTVVSEIGSMEASSCSSKPWTRLWKQIPPCMCCVNESGNVCSCIQANQRSHTWILKITLSCFQTKSSGLLMTLMYTELLSTKLLKVTWRLNLSTAQSSSLIPNPDNYFWRSSIQVSGRGKNVLGNWLNGRLPKKLQRW